MWNVVRCLAYISLLSLTSFLLFFTSFRLALDHVVGSREAEQSHTHIVLVYCSSFVALKIFFIEYLNVFDFLDCVDYVIMISISRLRQKTARINRVFALICGLFEVISNKKTQKKNMCMNLCGTSKNTAS